MTNPIDNHFEEVSGLVYNLLNNHSEDLDKQELLISFGNLMMKVNLHEQDVKERAVLHQGLVKLEAAYLHVNQLKAANLS